MLINLAQVGSELGTESNLVWALKVYCPCNCIHAYTCCQEQLVLDLLSTKTVQE